MATIFDKDIWIYAISKLQQAMFEEKPVSPTIQFSVYDFLTTTNRSVGGRAYEDFLIALKRLKGTTITTCITVNENEKKDHIFSLIEEVKASKTKKGRKISQ